MTSPQQKAKNLAIAAARAKARERSPDVPGDILDFYVMTAITDYEAAMLDAGMKMTPRQATDEMKRMGHDFTWETMWDAASALETSSD